MQEHLGASSNLSSLARVHVEGGANDGEREAAQDFLQDEESHQDPGAGTGRLVQQLSGVWGYAVIGSAFNLSLVAAISSLEWTNWGGDGAEASSDISSSAPSTSMPKYNKWTLGVFISVICPVFLSLRTTFAVATLGPHPLPGDGWVGWGYASYCFISMLISTLCVAGFIYVLPISLGGQLHYYFGDVVPMLLQGTVCVVFTAEVMKFFYKRDRRQGGDSAAQEQPGNEVGDEDHEGQEESQGFNCFQETLRQLNMLSICVVVLGC